MTALATKSEKTMANTPEELEAIITAKREARADPAPSKPPKTKITISIDQALADELRAANDQLGRRAFPSISAVFEAGGYAELEKLRKAHNDGEPFE